MMKKKSVFVLTAIVSVLLLAACEDLSVLAAQLDDEVKLANDRYLEVVGTYPEQNDQEINPSAPLWINFDRDINVDKVDGYIDIATQNSYGLTSDFIDDEGGTLTYSFDDTDTLSINTTPFLTGGAKIIVTLIAGLPGADGSVLRNTQSWSFYTGKLPAGTMEIVDGDPPYTDAADGFMNIEENAGVSIDISKEVTHYYISSTQDATLTTESPTTAVTSWEPIDDDPAYADLSFTINTGGGDDVSLNLLAASSTAISDPDGSKSLYIRFYDDEEETFSPIIEATTILDTTPPTISPYFAGSAYTPKAATVRAGASDANGIPVGNYQWESLTAPLGSEIVTFGSPNSSSSSVYVMNPDKTPAQIEHEYSLQVTAVDYAGNPGTGTIAQKLDWDRFVTVPTVEIFPDVVTNPDTDLLEILGLKDPVDPALHLISEFHLNDDYPEYGGINALSFRWILDEKDVPNDDLVFSMLSINGYTDPEKFDEYELNSGEYQGPNSKEYYPVVKIYPDGERLLPGYYQYGAEVFDKLDNQSDKGSNHISYVSQDFLKLIVDAMEGVEEAVWPRSRITGINRFPSFCWAEPDEVLAPMIGKYGLDPLYYKLRVESKAGIQTINIDDVERPYWFNSGPDDFTDLLGRQEVRWWYEIWLDEGVLGDYTDDKTVLYDEEAFLITFKDYYVFATGDY